MAKELRIYKPGNSGSAVKFQTVEKGKYKEWNLFGEFAPQIGKDADGNAKFDWRVPDNNNTKSITVKFSELDAAKALLVLRGEADTADLFHDPGKSYEESDGTKRSTVVKIAKGDRGFMINASNKVGENLKRVNISVSWEEGILLESYLSLFLQKFYS